MKQPIRYFSFGLLSSTLILMLFFLFSDDGQASIEDAPVETLVEVIKAEGYYVLSEDEYISLSVAGKTNNEDGQEETKAETDNSENDEQVHAEEANKEEKDNKEDKADDQEQAESESSIVTYTLTVEAGMLGPTISERLAENNIIEEPDKFSRYLEDEDYSRYIQLGEHTLTSDMSYYEIAEKITR